MLFILFLLGFAVGLTADPSPVAYDPPPPVIAEVTPTPTSSAKDVRTAARAAGFGDIADRLARAARGTAMVELGGGERAPSTPGTSRFGGDPDLPTDAKWPQCSGKPQTFVAQVRLRDLPAEAKELRRLGGTLLFFTQVELEPGETEWGLWGGDCSAVIHARPRTKLRRVHRPAEGTLDITSARMRFTGRYDVPEVAGDKLLPPLQDVAMPDWERWSEFRDGLLARIYPGHKLLGYHVEPNGGNECSARAERPKRTWRHLFTIDSDENLGFNVADAGRVQLLISPEDLARGRFDRVCGVFDSA